MGVFLRTPMGCMPSGPPPRGRVVSWSATRTLYGTTGYSLRVSFMACCLKRQSRLSAELLEVIFNLITYLKILHGLHIIVSRCPRQAHAIYNLLPQFIDNVRLFGDLVNHPGQRACR